jgi:hypothetical protein
LWLLGGGLRALVINLIALTLISSPTIFLYQISGNPIQWTALGIGVFAAFSWAQSLQLRDPPALRCHRLPIHGFYYLWHRFLVSTIFSAST